MRGEHCIAGASILTFMAMILLVFANIGQISSGAVTNGLHLVEVNVAAFGSAVLSANKQSSGLYNTKNTVMGASTGLRQYYRWGIYGACGYQKDNSGICNSTQFAYPFEPLATLISDAPTSPTNYKTIINSIIPSTASAFKNNGWNHSLSVVGSALIFIGSILTLLSFITGLVKHRLSFFVAAVSSGLSAFFLMVGAAIWTSIISKDSWLKQVKVQGSVALGITVTAGPALYLTWVSFVFVALSVAPYVISCCTFRK
ncbi:uncharacterized protein EHS24_001298 [Apiotrichum porosum]|uniref:Actin cortical patch SUR7/pH-response regulator PalI n=1 Tax=Apiotrichum porosum TaxID=105984 RepID=A0A427XKA0_9TREE|nr:uncharacterized protein EHS24_001298 [Apiotrichum porosum]RSH79258.1 hypothetical protein EHS24_001298 [Apiotrichum porosum]